MTFNTDLNYDIDRSEKMRFNIFKKKKIAYLPYDEETALMRSFSKVDKRVREIETAENQKNYIKKNTDISGRKRIPEAEIMPEKFYYEAKAFTQTYGLSNGQIRKEKKIYTKNPDKVVLIKMEMANGQFREFLAVEDLGCFFYKKSQYVFDSAMKYFLIERNIWAYDFHEYLTLPLRKYFAISEKLEKLLQPEIDNARRKPLNPHVDVNEAKTLIENSQLVDVEASINPTTLKRFTDSEVIKQVLQGAMLGRIFKIMFILIIIMAVFLLMILLTTLYHAGIFEKVGNLFHK